MDNAGLLQNGSIPFAVRTASHSSHNVCRLKLVFGLGLIRKLPVDRKKVDDALAHARRDLGTAGTILANDQDWAYTIAYNAVLQAGRALMFSKGYRPDGANQHVAVVKFSELFLDAHDTITFDRMRGKRNSSVYDTAGSITESEAEFALEQAEILVGKIEACISR